MKFSMIAGALSLMAGLASADVLATGEYFIDSDPGYGNATPIPGVGTASYAGGLTLTPQFLAGLSGATHLLGIRFQDADGEWGMTQMTIFSPQSADSAVLARGEYFLNADPGEGLATVITAEEGVDFSGALNLAPAVLDALPSGPNLLGVRFQDGNGDWGATVFHLLDPDSADEAKLSRGEYFINSDPGEGLATAISLSGETAHGGLVTLSGSFLQTLPTGMNLLGVRFQDSDGEWGESSFRLFDNISDEGHDLSEVRWKLIKDGVVLKSGTLLPNFANRVDLIVGERDLNISVGDLVVLELQAFDSKGNGGSKFHRNITVGTLRQDFLDQYFTAEEQAGGIADDLADPDGDGVVNLLEEALGLNPREGSPPVGALSLESGGTSFSFSSQVPLEFDAPNSRFTLGALTYELAVSADLEDWRTAAYPADFTLPASPTEEGGRFLQKIVLTEEVAGMRFYHLKVVRGE